MLHTGLLREMGLSCCMCVCVSERGNVCVVLERDSELKHSDSQNYSETT